MALRGDYITECLEEINRRIAYVEELEEQYIKPMDTEVENLKTNDDIYDVLQSINKKLDDSDNGISTKIRESYDIKDYIDEIKYHAIGFNIGIKDSHTEMADIGPYDPNWQTLIWEGLW